MFLGVVVINYLLLLLFKCFLSRIASDFVWAGTLCYGCLFEFGCAGFCVLGLLAWDLLLDLVIWFGLLLFCLGLV